MNALHVGRDTAQRTLLVLPCMYTFWMEFSDVIILKGETMNDFPVIGYPCFAHRILGSPGGKHCESLQRNVWRGVVSPLKAVSLDRECRILP